MATKDPLIGLTVTINPDAKAAKGGGKPWVYLLVPHDAVAQNMTLAALRARYEVK